MQTILGLLCVVLIIVCAPACSSCATNTLNEETTCASPTWYNSRAHCLPWITEKEDLLHPWQDGFTTCESMTAHPQMSTETQTFQLVENRPIFVFSAFYERRPTVDGPSVRIIAGGLQQQFNDIGDVYCQLWFQDKATPLVVKAKYEVIYNSIAHGDMWTAHFILCPLKKDVGIPYIVSITPEQCSIPSNHLLILNRDEPKPSRSFGVCLSAIYGRYKDWVGIAEMFEMYTIVGANEIVIYNYSLSYESNIAMHFYLQQSDRNITAVQWQLPNRMQKSSTFFQRGVLNDCLYRLSHRHMFVAMQDLDEVIAPRIGDSWSEVFDHIYDPSRAVYMFQHSYFRRNKTNEKPYTITQSSFWTTKDVYPKGKIRCKSMYNPLLTKSVDVHFHYALIPGMQEYMVPPEIAKLHHYRISPMESFRKDPTIEFVEDRYLEKYKPELMRNLRQAVERINNVIEGKNKK